jgi:uncharacterized protein YjbI with pentapeptide repeats
MTDEPDRTDGTEATPDGAAAFAKKAKDLEALRGAVIDAASVGAGLWLSYLFVLFYLAIAVGSVTHRNLLFESAVKLPFLNVDLPLIGFFVLGPGIFLIVHAYVLLHFVLLADKVGAFHAELQAQITDEEARTRLRRQLPSNIFVQFLAGPHEVRSGVMGFLLRLIAQISLVGGPLALLVFFQLQFLPYHHEAIAWWQRLAVVADLALLWTLWPSVARGETTRLRWRDFRWGKVAAWGVASLVPVLLIFTIATFPGEWLDSALPPLRFVPTKMPASKVAPERWTLLSPHELLVGGDVDFIGLKPTSLWSNRLVLPAIDVTGHAKSDTEAGNVGLAGALSLRGRRLEGAVLIDARLRNTDFTAVQLQGADLSGADLREARFECAVSWHERHCAHLQGASLLKAQLQGALLSKARLQGAKLDRAQLQGASLDGAHLQAASLVYAQLHGASLVGVQLQGASLVGAQLQGASLDEAHLQAAELRKARLQGASLTDAELQGATLRDVELQGAALFEANLRGTKLVSISVWRADVREAYGEGAWVKDLETGPKSEDLGCGSHHSCDWSADAFAALTQLLEEQVPKGAKRDAALELINTLDPRKRLDGEEAMIEAWKHLEKSRPADDGFDLVESLRKIGCEADGAPYVIPGLLSNFHLYFKSDSPELAPLAAIFLDEARCPGAHGLSEEHKLTLREIRDRRPSASPSAASTTPMQ